MNAALTHITNQARRSRDTGIDIMWRHLPGTFHCPLCDHTGTFAPALSRTGNRQWARCPRCGAMERHRLQAHAVRDIVTPWAQTKPVKVLHLAPEQSIGRLLKQLATTYETSDPYEPGVDHRIDLRDIPFPDGSYDLVYASHVLEHIDDDLAAIKEIRRITAPGGIAILPVPLTGPTTIEYAAPNPYEALHWRAPGLDYFDRLADTFDRIQVIWSHDAPAHNQPYVFENRSKWPTKHMPDRQPSPGRFHTDAVPLCYVNETQP